MKQLYNWIVIVLFIIVFGWVIVSNARYNNLKDDYQLLLNKDSYIIDSLQKENVNRELKIKSLENRVFELTETTDSLKELKVEIYKDTFEVSTSISEGVSLLKENLKCVEL